MPPAAPWRPRRPRGLVRRTHHRLPSRGWGTQPHNFRDGGSSRVTWSTTRGTPTLEGAAARAETGRPPGGRGARPLGGVLLCPRPVPPQPPASSTGRTPPGSREWSPRGRASFPAQRTQGRRPRLFPGSRRAVPGGRAPSLRSEFGREVGFPPTNPPKSRRAGGGGGEGAGRDLGEGRSAGSRGPGGLPAPIPAPLLGPGGGGVRGTRPET